MFDFDSPIIGRDNNLNVLSRSHMSSDRKLDLKAEIGHALFVDIVD